MHGKSIKKLTLTLLLLSKSTIYTINNYSGSETVSQAALAVLHTP